MSHFNVSLIVWAKSRDSVHKLQIFEEKRKESRSGSNRGPSAYQPSALPLGHTGSPLILGQLMVLKSVRGHAEEKADAGTEDYEEIKPQEETVVGPGHLLPRHLAVLVRL